MTQEQLIARLDEIANELTALFVVANQVSPADTTDHIEAAIASLEAFIEESKTP